MSDVHYICTGSCHGVATEEQYKNGATTCAATSCEKHGQPLEKSMYCSACDTHYKEGEKCGCA